jgi:hypothetical protein
MNTITWETPAGSVRVLPERGRVLGIKTGGQESLWSPEPPPFPWCLGGERLWFGPEADWHWLKPDKPDFAFYKVPPALDPDEWTITESRDGFFSSRIDLTLRAAHRDAFVKLRVTRSVELLPEDGLAPAAGGITLSTRTGLEILDGTPGQPVDFWSLVQVPHGGSMIIPTVGECSPRDYFAPTPDSEFSVHASHVEIRIRGAASFKLGISPDRAAGRTAYVRPTPGGHLVLDRSFPVHPELFYCDAPLDAQDTQGDALQFYCDNGSLGAFGELEHRTPAIRCGSGPQTLSETAITRVMLLDATAFAGWKSQFTGA